VLPIASAPPNTSLLPCRRLCRQEGKKKKKGRHSPAARPVAAVVVPAPPISGAAAAAAPAAIAPAPAQRAAPAGGLAKGVPALDSAGWAVAAPAARAGRAAPAGAATAGAGAPGRVPAAQAGLHRGRRGGLRGGSWCGGGEERGERR